MKAITLYQPWASWIALGWKIIETRTHPRFQSLEHQRIAIHAGLKYDRHALSVAGEYLNDEQFKQHAFNNGYRWPHGVIVCTVYVWRHARCVSDDSAGALIECVTPRYGLFLRDIEPLKPVVHCNGQRGIWNIDL
jgi:hypothetical protein